MALRSRSALPLRLSKRRAGRPTLAARRPTVALVARSIYDDSLVVAASIPCAMRLPDNNGGRLQKFWRKLLAQPKGKVKLPVSPVIAFAGQAS
jgi:hypothetical protein